MLVGRQPTRSNSDGQRYTQVENSDWNNIIAQYILPSDYPTQIPSLLPKSVRGFFSRKHVSTVTVSPLMSAVRRTSRIHSPPIDATPIQQQLVSQLTRRQSLDTFVLPANVATSNGNDFNGDDDVQEVILQRMQLKRSFSLVPERFDSTVCNHTGLPIPSRGQALLLHCEHLLIFINCLLVILGLPFSLIFCLRVVPQYERAVIFRLGRLTSKISAGPGLIFTLPCLDTVKRVDLRTFTFDVPTQEVLTRDSVTVAVNAVVYYRIFDPVMSVVNVKNVNWSTRLLAQTTLRNVLGTVDMCRLLTDREHMAALMQEALDVSTATWGMKVERVEIKDVRLPLQLQRTLAAEAEATCAAKAKVIAAKGEKEASRSLKEAALEISSCPTALQLRYLQTLNSISAEKNSTIIFPLPLEITSFFKRISSGKKRRSDFQQTGEIKPSQHTSLDRHQYCCDDGNHRHTDSPESGNNISIV